MAGMPHRHASPGIGGLRVLDLAGPPGIYGTKLLADLGADVIRIEPPGGDPLRVAGPFYRNRPGPERSLSFALYNTSKRSIELDLDSEEGRERFRRLTATADFVFETAAPGELAAKGIGFEHLRKSNPGLIWAAITPFGQSGPRAGWKGSDLIAMAAGGVLYLSGFPGETPIYSPFDQAYHQGGIAAVTGALIAYHHRMQSGKGQLVDVSLQAAVATCTEATLGFWDYMGQNWERKGLNGLQGFQALYPCQDGWVIGMLGNRWENLLAWAEEVGVAGDEWRNPRWRERSERDTHRPEISTLAAQLFAAQTMEQIYLRGQHYRIAFQPVLRVPHLLADPQLAFRGFWTPVAHDDLGTTITYPGAPFLSTSGFWRMRRRAPAAGEHSAEILNELHSGPNAGDRALTPSPLTRTSPEQGRGGKVQPLAGTRIVDFSAAATGPLATRTFADHGAEVIKVEFGQRPDGTHLNIAPRLPGNPGVNVSANFNALNAGKRDITLNMNLTAANELVKELVKIADVVVDNYGRDPFPKWGLSYEEARELRPDIIMARSSTKGRSGPRNGDVGFGTGIAAAAGWNTMMGFPGEPPAGMGPAYPDFSVNCHHLMIAILTALEHRRRTGEGQYIDLSQTESTITWIGPAVLDYIVNGAEHGPRANRHPDYAPHGVYRAAGDDRWIAIACDPGSWDLLVRAASEDFLDLRREEFASHDARKANEDDLDAALRPWIASQDPETLAERLQRAGIAAYNIATGRDLVEDSQLAYREHFVQLEHPEPARAAGSATPSYSRKLKDAPPAATCSARTMTGCSPSSSARAPRRPPPPTSTASSDESRPPWLQNAVFRRS
jgi:crotonobetainyl-CoA:carnitine CoA-transferase CaiB-like acyl-CoA transferase